MMRRRIGPSSGGGVNTRICGKCSIVRLFLLTLIAVYLLAVTVSLRSARSGPSSPSVSEQAMRLHEDQPALPKSPFNDEEDEEEDDVDVVATADQKGIISDLDRDMREAEEHQSSSASERQVITSNDEEEEDAEDEKEEDSLGKDKAVREATEEEDDEHRLDAANSDKLNKQIESNSASTSSEDEEPTEPAPDVLLFSEDEKASSQSGSISDVEVELEKIRPKSKVRRLLDSFRTNDAERHIELNSQPDYRNPVYVKENQNLTEQMAHLRDEEVSLRESLRLITRLGHRRRVTDLIGGQPMDPEQSRAEIRERTSVFDRQDHPDSRNYVEQPIRIHMDVNTETLCAVPCAKCDGGPQCDSDKEHMSMENVFVKNNDGAYSFGGNTLLTSNVPLPYFSWHDFGIMRSITRAEKTQFAAAFISNCAFAKRNKMVRDLIEKLPGKTVHSYGSCENNKKEAGPKRSPDSKLDHLQSYFFSLAFENSETNDYVTEKFFGSLTAGSVPVYIGAPNIKFFAPDTGDYPYESDALVRVKDYSDDSDQLVKVLKALDEDREAYDGLLKWKKTGYSDDFKALIDLTAVHSSCRACIFIADERRRKIGPNKFDVSTIKRDPSGGSFSLYARERGSYSFVEISFEQPPTSLIQLIRKILERVRRKEVTLWRDNDDLRELRHVSRVYAIYTPLGRRPILSDDDLKALPNRAELEVIFV